MENKTSIAISQKESGNTASKVAIPLAILFVLFLTAFTFWPREDNSADLSSLTKRIEQIESSTEGALSSQDKQTLTELSTTLESIQSKSDNLPNNTKETIQNLQTRIATLENSSSSTTSSTSGTTTVTNNATTTIANTDASDLTTGTVDDSLLSNNVTLQGNTFNTNSKLVQLNSSGLLPALNGSNLTNIDSDTLQGNSASYYTNATNIASGTLADTRLSSNVPLLNSSNTFTNTISLTSAGTALSVTNTASIGTLSVTNNATVGGTLDVTGALTTESSITFGTNITGTCEGLTNYVWVPGNPKYGTMPGFCVMQYEAKNDGSNNAISQADTTPWVSISQRDARTKAREACEGCHLITEQEWMTIAENVAFVDANWSGGAVGSGCIFRGNIGSVGDCNYNGSDPEYGTGRDVKARLALSTGEYIWDLSGNAWEWTDQYLISDKGPVDATPASELVDYTNVANYGAYEYMKPPVDTWSSTQGLGRLYSGYDNGSSISGVMRGGNWSSGSSYAGILSVGLSSSPSLAYSSFSFRVAR